MTDSATGAWTLGVWVGGGASAVSLVPVRNVSAAEFENVDAGMRRLRSFGCYSLDGGFPEALDAVNLMIDGMTNSAMEQVNSSEFKVKLRIAIDHWLSQITVVRTHFQWLGKLYPTGELPMDIDEMFLELYTSNPAYRLVWELRNLSQHAEPISNYLSFRVELDEHEVTRGTYFLEMSKLTADHTSGKNWRGWKACFDLWTDSPEQLDLKALFRDAYLAIYRVAAEYTFSFRDQLDADARAVVDLANEGSGRGAMVLYRLDDLPGPVDSWPMTTLGLDRDLLNEAWRSLENARFLFLDPTTSMRTPIPRFSDIPPTYVPQPS